MAEPADGKIPRNHRPVRRSGGVPPLFFIILF
jgi:hypothetical protein